jgi:SHAQKYF class myb-like DNA-binding protein
LSLQLREVVTKPQRSEHQVLLPQTSSGSMSEDAAGMKRKRPSGAANANIEGSESADDYGEVASGKWSEEMHRYFVAAIYDCGLRHSSPSVIMENMSTRPASLTSERVKSHLQKYRKHKEKSKEAFMADYDSFMRKAVTVGGAGGSGVSHVVMPPSAMIEMMGGGKPSGGDIAAFLSYSAMTEGDNTVNGKAPLSSLGIAKESQDYLKNFSGTNVPFPQLTEEEKRSPLGISMVYVMGLFSSMSQYMMQERRKRLRANSSDAPSSCPDSSLAADRAINALENPFSGQKGPSGEQSSFVPWGDPFMQQPSGKQHAAALTDTSSGKQISQGYYHPMAHAPGFNSSENPPYAAGWNTIQQAPGLPVFEAAQGGVVHPKSLPGSTSKAANDTSFAQV